MILENLVLYNDVFYEKYLLRKAFEDDLPNEIVWRRKEAFSDGVGGIQKPFYKHIQENLINSVKNGGEK